MEKRTFCVVFFCKKTKITRKGKAPIYVRITTRGQSTEIYTRCQIEPEKWNQKAERSLCRDKISVQINDILASYRASILAAYDGLIKEGKEPNCFAMKQRLVNPYENTKQFLSELDKYCEKRQAEVGVRITQLTANKYHRLLRYLREYTQSQYKKNDLPLESVSYEYIDGFNTFLQTAHNCKNNGAVNLLCCLKNFILYAIRNEWIEKNPFKYYKLKEEHNKAKDHLTQAELEQMIVKPMPNERLERIRDVFAFCCFTGLAFTDADHRRKKHITTAENGTVWIHKPREKTSVMSRIPLLSYAIRLLRKYEHDAKCREQGKMLPIPSNTKMNAYLKEIADICNIGKTLTTHVARHTFACVAIEYGMPINVLAKILGHTNVNMTRHYAKISETNISREMMKIGDKFKIAQ
ncbi:site-specific integrase [Rikenella microfusus]|uniref:Tyrosine recombinase XerC n=1 Tax=Rikenella microfusus TaxID=28139 RepID=A0A379MQE1_9BACT|nr:site-specific integrase [Rikenella microfusus]SUE33858.1 Tyrosine recombinase XerC [Rikenella microfusus]